MEADVTRNTLNYMHNLLDNNPNYDMTIAEKTVKELEELERISTEYESNKHYIELGKAVKKAFEEGFTVIKGCYGSCDKELCFDEQLLEWAEGGK